MNLKDFVIYFKKKEFIWVIKIVNGKSNVNDDLGLYNLRISFFFFYGINV